MEPLTTSQFEGLESIWESQPFDLLGVDSDNGGQFLNFHLYHWLRKHGIEQTRSRPYYKNDQAYPASMIAGDHHQACSRTRHIWGSRLA